MNEYRVNEKFNAQKVDKLFSEFIREMDDHTTNGIIKHLDPVKVEPMVDHFLGQCDNFIDKLELRDRIEILLSTKFDYALAEERLQISENLDKSIQEKIKDVLKEHFKNAGKFAGFILNWTLIKPIKIFRTAVEPVVANTVLTYSLAVHPPYLDSAETQYLNAIKPVNARTTESVITADNALQMIKEFETVKKYSDEDLTNLTENPSEAVGSSNEKQIVTSKKVRPGSSNINTNLSRENDASQKLHVDLHRRIIEPAAVTAFTESGNTGVNRYAGELRPIGDIQRIISQNDHRIYNCFNLYKKNYEKKNGRISMKFQITSKGMVKDVKITYNSFNKELADRVTLQIKTVRFSEIDGKLGDQTVYHTFYF